MSKKIGDHIMNISLGLTLGALVTFLAYSFGAFISWDLWPTSPLTIDVVEKLLRMIFFIVSFSGIIVAYGMKK